MVYKEQIETAFVEQQKHTRDDFFIDREPIKAISVKTSHIVVLTGIRRCGKSTYMQQLIVKHYQNVAFFNFEDPRIFGFSVEDFSKLSEVMGNDKEAYFFDEIQNIIGWEVFVRQLHDRGKKVFITGSNANLLSKELGTRLTGRYLSYEIFPFSYQEYLVYFKKNDSDDVFLEYIQLGGFPEYLKDKLDEIVQTLLKDIVYKDIAIRYGVKNSHILMQIALYLISNVGKEVSINNIKNAFSVGSTSSVSDYLHWFAETYLFFFVPRFSWSQKSIVRNPKKVYTIDTGFAHKNSLSFTSDYGRLLENFVYIQLRKRNLEVYYFKEKKECDFVVFQNTVFQYAIQVCTVLHADNRLREMEGLLVALDFFKINKGYILTMNQTDTIQIENKTIEIVKAKDFVF
ncbi:MAG: ATP-binding protein [Bacteroidetes bacterium]|nr:MAG: ATP-binding protein [Bacteroidota bacterium]